MELPKSVLTKEQKKVSRRQYTEEGIDYRADINIRFDDECGNGHNTFSLTCAVWRKQNGRWVEDSAGCQHDLIARISPTLRPYIKWHLVSTDGPMHYIANTMYHASAISWQQRKYYFYLEGKLIRIVDEAERDFLNMKYGKEATFKDYPNPAAKEPNLQYARECAVWPDATLEQLQDTALLTARLPALMEAFKHDMEELGFTY